MLHSLHKSIWPTDSDEYRPDEATAERVTQVIMNWIKSKPLIYRFLPLDLEKFVSYAMRNLQQHNRNQILIHDLISVIFVHLRDDC